MAVAPMILYSLYFLVSISVWKESKSCLNLDVLLYFIYYHFMNFLFSISILSWSPNSEQAMIFKDLFLMFASMFFSIYSFLTLIRFIDS